MLSVSDASETRTDGPNGETICGNFLCGYFATLLLNSSVDPLSFAFNRFTSRACH